MKSTYTETCIIKNNIEEDPQFFKLYGIFKATLKHDMSFRHFKGYYLSKGLEYIDVSFMYNGTTLTGFCAAAFYKSVIHNKPHTVGRSATGILKEYQGQGLYKWTLYFKFIRYKLKHPLQQLLLTAYVANPIIYAMMCKYTGIVFPRLTTNVPEKIERLKDEVLKNSGLTEKATGFTVKIHFEVEKGEALLHRIYTSTSKFIRYYLSINPAFREQYGVLVIVPVTWINIMLTSGRFVYYGIPILFFKLPSLLLTTVKMGKERWLRMFNFNKTFIESNSGLQDE